MTLLSILGVLSSAIFSGTSLLYATLGEVVGERSGVVNLGLEGVLLAGASAGFAATVLSGNPWLGVLVAVLVGGLMNGILGFLVLIRKANQLASGLTLMFFGFGVSALMGRSFVGARIQGIPRVLFSSADAGPGDLGRLFGFDPLVYLALPMAALIWWLLFRTRWGLGVRAVGESADATFASGRNPVLIRFQALFVSGILAGLGAAHLALAYTLTWTSNMTGGRGFIAVALAIFSRWHPLRAIGGALFFSGAVAFQLMLQSSGVQVSPFLLDTIPYVLTILVLIFGSGNRKQSAPASLGRVFHGVE